MGEVHGVEQVLDLLGFIPTGSVMLGISQTHAEIKHSFDVGVVLIDLYNLATHLNRVDTDEDISLQSLTLPAIGVGVHLDGWVDLGQLVEAAQDFGFANVIVAVHLVGHVGWLNLIEVIEEQAGHTEAGQLFSDM